MPSVVLGLGDTTSQRGQGLRGGVGLVLGGLVPGKQGWGHCPHWLLPTGLGPLGPISLHLPPPFA